MHARERTNVAVERFVWNRQPEGNPRFFNDLVPAIYAPDGILYVVIAQHLVQRIQHRDFFFHKSSVPNLQNAIHIALELVVVLSFSLFEATFKPGGIKRRGITGLIGTK